MSREDISDTQLKAMSIEELAEAIKHHNRLYELNTTVISDENFDALIQRLQELDPHHISLQKFTSPTVASSGKVQHVTPMLSLDKAYSLKDVITWAEKYIRSKDELMLIQPKYDGISANYQAGILATRGDGSEGENITDKLPLIELVTKNYRGVVDRPARGEIIIPDNDFQTIFTTITKKDGTPYKNSRNATAGIMALKEIDDIQQQGAKLTLVDYNFISYRVAFSELNSKWAEIVEKIENLDYPTDGIVIKFADNEYSRSLGYTAHHPRGQIAFKFSGIRRKTELIAVEWSFGKNCLTPRAEFKPVAIGGATIRHATLHNLQNIIDKDIWVGDIVTVERAGDVIPYIIESEQTDTRTSCMIDNCPSCQSKLVREGPELCCRNPNCFETNLQLLLGAVKNIGIDRLGEPNIRKMMLKLDVKGLYDIFKLKITDILSLEGFKEKSATNLYREIQRARQVNDYQLLAALNIGGIGQTVAKSILDRFTLYELRSLTAEQLAEIDGIGPERGRAIEEELKKQSLLLDKLLTCVEVVSSKGSAGKQKPSICFTGKMPEKRSFYEKIAKQQGYEVTSTVSNTLSLLVAANRDDSSSKLQKAMKNGIKIVDLPTWLLTVQTDKPEEKTETQADDLFPAAHESPEHGENNDNNSQLSLGL